jgi:hypothetical protein
VLAALAVPTGAGAARGAAPCSDGMTGARTDGWTTVPAPLFRQGSPYFTDYVAGDGKVLFATNGSSVVRTSDGGCRWTDTYDVSSPDPRAEGGIRPRITQLASAQGAASFLALGLAQQPVEAVGAATSPSVTVSRDAGATWQSADKGLPPLGIITALAFGRGATTGYALLTTTVGTPRTTLYTTAATADVWTPQPTSPELTGIAPGAAPGEVWAWGTTGLLHSLDSAVTLTPVPDVTGTVTAVTAPPPTGTATPVVFTTTGRWSSVDAGRSWQRTAFPGRVDSAAYDPSDALLVASGPDGLWAVVAAGPPRRVGPSTQEYLRKIAILPGRPRTVIGLTRAALFRGLLSPRLGKVIPPPTVALPDLAPLDLHAGTGPRVTVPTVTPGTLDVNLPVGGTKTVRYTLDLPPTPTPLDVFFLVDTTNSFQPIIRGLRNQLGDIVNRLTALHIDAQFGVGAFREYPTAVEGSAVAGDNYAYRLIRRIGPVDDQLQAALYALRTGGGSTDGRTSALAAEYQAATGAGQQVAPTAADDGYLIPAHLDAKFRPGAEHVILTVTDTEPRNAQAGYPGPSIEATGNALAGRGVAQVGLVVGQPPDGTPGPRATLEKIAVATGAVAPAEGVDCDGDGVPDLDAQQPLVCTLNGIGLSSAIVALLRGVRDEAAVELDVSGDPRAAAAASSPVFPAVNLKAYTRLPYDVKYSCVAALAGRTLPVQLQAVSRGLPLAGARARVRCGLPTPPAPVVPPVQQVAAAVPPVPAPPPAPVVHTNPLTNPNPNPNPQANLNAQAGVAVNEQSRPQVALAGQESDVESELAMSDRPQQATDPRLLLGCAVLLSVAMGGAGLSQRRGLVRQHR